MFERERARILGKSIRFEMANRASEPVFNIEKTTRGFVILREGNSRSGRCYKVSTQRFVLLRMICSSPLSLTEMGIILGKSEQTLKNQRADLYRAFGIDRGRSTHSQTRLISSLVEREILHYEPSIASDQMPILNDA